MMRRVRAPVLVMSIAFGLASCASGKATAPAPAPPTANSTEPSPAPEAPPPAPPAKVLPVCEAKHSLPELPLAAINVDAFREQLERHVPLASGGRPAPFDDARPQVDAYVARLGACMERVFVGSFLPSLSSLPKDHPLSDMTLTTTVELAVDGETGALATSGVVSSSGVPEFDAAVLATFAGVLPIGKLPPEILSSDWRFYVTWEVRRDEKSASDLGLARAWKLRF